MESDYVTNAVFGNSISSAFLNGIEGPQIIDASTKYLYLHDYKHLTFMYETPRLHHMYNSVNIGSRGSLLYDGSKPLSELMLYQWGSVAFHHSKDFQKTHKILMCLKIVHSMSQPASHGTKC